VIALRRLPAVLICCALLAGAALLMGARHAAVPHGARAPAQGALALSAQRALHPADPPAGALSRTCSVSTEDCVAGCVIPVAERPPSPRSELSECRQSGSSGPCALPVSGDVIGVPSPPYRSVCATRLPGPAQHSGRKPTR